MEFKFTELKTQEEVLDIITYHNMYSSEVVIDTETTDKDPRKAKLLTIQISGRNKTEACLFYAEHASCLLSLKPNIKLILQNFKYDYHVLHRHGVDLRPWPMSDTMLLHHLLDENLPHGLDGMVKAVWDDPYKALFWAKYPTFDSAPPEAKLDYACRDVVYTGLLHTDFIKQLEQENIPDALVKSAHALALALFDTELEGIAIDLNYLADRGVFLSSKILDGKSAINSSIGIIKDTIEMDLWAKELAKKKTPRGWENCKRPEFSVDSSQQIMLLLYKYLKLQTQFNEKTKSPSVDDASLEKLESAHPVVPLLREYRGHQKIYSSYIEGTLERQINGRIYPSFNINGTHTGRISSSNPNMQQLPRDGGIRGIYVPDLGHKFISCDYSQLEVVIAAHYSRDPSLLKIVLEGANQHDITAKGLGIPRPMAKTINFALQYGAGVRKVQSILNCSEKEAKRAFAAYWETYPGVKRLMDECSMLVDNNQPIVNIFGRKRRFPEVFEENWMKAKAKRQAFNFLVQSTGADITHRAYIKMHRTMLDRKWGKALFEVHDEILVMSLEAHVKMTQLTLSETMISIGREAELSVPLKVDCSEPKDRWEK